MYQFKLPDIGEGTHEAEIINWRVKVGDRVHEDEPLVEIQSDKATVDLPSPVAGIVTKLVGEEGDLALVGSVIVEIETSATAGVGATEPVSPPVASASPAGQPTTAIAAPASDAALTGVQRRPVTAAEVDIRTLAVPRVRHFARQHGVDLRSIVGTGRSGLITMADVEAALAQPTAPASQPSPASAQPAAHMAEPSPAPQPGITAQPPEDGRQPAQLPTPATMPTSAPSPRAGSEDELRVPMSPIRRATARAMVQAVTTVPHVTVFDRADVTALVTHRAGLKQRAAERGIKLTYTPYLVKACVAMLKRHPELNAYADMAALEIVYRSAFNISVATNTSAGLLVPVVRDADRLSLFEIAAEIDRLGGLAQAGQLSGEQMRGGSMTITNVGGAATGGVWSTPILNVPEALIVGIGRIEGEFWPDEQRQPVLRDTMKISFGFDHRLVDGVAAQLALNDFKAFLSDPDYLLAES